MGELEPLAGTVGCSLLVGLRMPPLYREVLSRMAASEGHCGPLAKAPAGTSMRVPHVPLSLLKGVTRGPVPRQGRRGGGPQAYNASGPGPSRQGPFGLSSLKSGAFRPAGAVPAPPHAQAGSSGPLAGGCQSAPPPRPGGPPPACLRRWQWPARAKVGRPVGVRPSESVSAGTWASAARAASGPGY